VNKTVEQWWILKAFCTIKIGGSAGNEITE